MPESTGLAVSPICHGILWGRIIIDGIGGHAELKPNSWDAGGPVDAVMLMRQMLDGLIDGIGGHAELKPNSWDAGGPVDAVMLMRQMLDGLDVLNRRWALDPRKNHPLMELPNQVVVTQVRAGEHPSSFAGAAEIVIDVQYLPSEKDAFGLGGNVKREVEDYIAMVCAADPYLAARPASVAWILDADCAEVPTDHPFVGAMAEALTTSGRAPRLWGLGAHSDMGLPTDMGGTPTIMFGPGDPTQAHQPNEMVPVVDLVEATKVMALAIRHRCA